MLNCPRNLAFALSAQQTQFPSFSFTSKQFLPIFFYPANSFTQVILFSFAFHLQLFSESRPNLRVQLFTSLYFFSQSLSLNFNLFYLHTSFFSLDNNYQSPCPVSPKFQTSYLQIKMKDCILSHSLSIILIQNIVIPILVLFCSQSEAGSS